LAATFTAAFFAAAVAVYMLAFFLGVVVHVSDVSLELRRAIAANGLILLAAVDLIAVKMRICCPLGLSRQTPRTAMFKYPPWLAAGIWGFDTGLVLTTFRVAASTWGAFLVAFLGLSGSLIGIAYGVGFTLPLMVMLWTGRVVDWPIIRRLLDLRPVAQFGSALLLTTGGLAVLLETLV
jgi:hypothetical protein